MNTEYRLIVIEDGQVPLASGAIVDGMPFYVWTLIAMLAVLLVVCIVGYCHRCIYYKQRLAELTGDDNLDAGWNIRELRRKAREAEWNVEF